MSTTEILEKFEELLNDKLPDGFHMHRDLDSYKDRCLVSFESGATRTYVLAFNPHALLWFNRFELLHDGLEKYALVYLKRIVLESYRRAKSVCSFREREASTRIADEMNEKLKESIRKAASY